MTDLRPPRRHRVVAVAAGLALLVGLTACDEAAPGTPAAVVADLDTFAVSSQPTANRANDTVLRVMDSAGKTKVGLTSFVVHAEDSTTLDGILYVHPLQSGFTVQVRNADPIAPTTTYQTLPDVGAPIGELASTVANTRQGIALRGLRVTDGRAHLAITTSSLYELEIVSAEGAEARSQPADAPSLLVGTATVPTTTAGPTTTPTTTTTPGPKGWNLTFADEFSGTSVDTTRWNVYDQSKGDSVESPKASTCPLARNVTVASGMLTMRTQKANGTCSGGQAHSGAGLNTWGRFEQAGGRFEVRGRWTHSGNYLWGGFWTHGNGGSGWTKENPTEIDVWEYIGKNAQPNISRFKPAIHYNYTCEGTCGMQNVSQLGYDVTAWHVYAVEWEPTDPADPTTMQIRFYLDGRQIAQFDKAGAWQVNPDGTKVLVTAGAWKNPAAPFPNPFGLDRNHKLILSAWVGAPGVDAATVAAGYNPTGGHADLQIDYVRVYER